MDFIKFVSFYSGVKHILCQKKESQGRLKCKVFMMEKVADCPTHRFSIMECALLVLQGCKCPCSFRMDPQYGPIQCFYKGSIDRVQEMIDSVSVSSENSVSCGSNGSGSSLSSVNSVNSLNCLN